MNIRKLIAIGISMALLSGCGSGNTNKPTVNNPAVTNTTTTTASTKETKPVESTVKTKVTKAPAETKKEEYKLDVTELESYLADEQTPDNFEKDLGKYSEIKDSQGINLLEGIWQKGTPKVEENIRPDRFFINGDAYNTFMFLTDYTNRKRRILNAEGIYSFKDGTLTLSFYRTSWVGGGTFDESSPKDKNPYKDSFIVMTPVNLTKSYKLELHDVVKDGIQCKAIKLDTWYYNISANGYDYDKFADNLPAEYRNVDKKYQTQKIFLMEDNTEKVELTLTLKSANKYDVKLSYKKKGMEKDAVIQGNDIDIDPVANTINGRFQNDRYGNSGSFTISLNKDNTAKVGISLRDTSKSDGIFKGEKTLKLNN